LAKIFLIIFVESISLHKWQSLAHTVTYVRKKFKEFKNYIK
jgi:hypothetical protein